MYKSEAMVLNIRESGERDLLVSFFTKDFGKMVIKARGGRRIGAKQTPFFSQFAILELMFILGRNFPIARGVVSLRSYAGARSHLYSYGYIHSFLRLCDNILYENSKDIAVWDLLLYVMESSNEILLRYKDESDRQDALWQVEKEWLSGLIKITGDYDGTSVGLGENSSPDIYFRDLLQKNRSIPICFFGLLARHKEYERLL